MKPQPTFRKFDRHGTNWAFSGLIVQSRNPRRRSPPRIPLLGPPPADQLDANYFHGGIDPLTLKLHVDAQAVKGPHDIPAKLSYFYCVAASTREFRSALDNMAPRVKCKENVVK